MADLYDHICNLTHSTAIAHWSWKLGLRPAILISLQEEIPSVCLSVHHHFFLLWIFNNLMLKDHTNHIFSESISHWPSTSTKHKYSIWKNINWQIFAHQLDVILIHKRVQFDQGCLWFLRFDLNIVSFVPNARFDTQISHFLSTEHWVTKGNFVSSTIGYTVLCITLFVSIIKTLLINM